MSDIDQVPFDPEFASNPEPRCPCVLLLDTSGSMSGAKIAELNAGLQVFSEQLKSDSMAAKRVEVSVITFGHMNFAQEFVTADAFMPPTLTAGGDTPMGAAITTAISHVNERKKVYRQSGISFYRPWLFLITDGAPTDDTRTAETAIREGEASKSLMFYAVGVDSADMKTLSKISVRQPLMLRGLSFRELFVWLSNSLGTVSRSQPSDAPQLANPIAPNGWAVAG